MKYREFWGNWMALESSLDLAKDQTPKAEWSDIKCFVEKQAHTDLLKLCEEMAGTLKKIERNQCYDCSCGNVADDALDRYRKFKEDTK